jgi:hypothetical protein
MNINRHNYEEFFLLYVDKELSAAERRAVDVFVKQNPDLKMELELLQQTVIKADDIVLDKKNWLYMEEDISALQENLLLYADGELSIGEKESVEGLLVTDKTAQAEWDILQQTKLQPDMAVVFADKKSLYKKEPGRIVAFNWRRVAAAAILIGLGLFAGVSVYNNYSKRATGEELANKVDKKLQAPVEIIPNTNVLVTPSNTVENLTEENIASTKVDKDNQQLVNQKEKTDVVNTTSKNSAASNNEIAVQKNNAKQDNNLSKSTLEKINNNRSNKIIVADVLSSNNSNKLSGNNDAVAKINPKENPINTIDPNNNKTDFAVTQVVNKNGDGENTNRYLDVDNDKEKRTALGGFLRKAKRVLERTTNVKPGDGVKIAGFEISLK